MQAEVGALDEGELGLDERHENAVAALTSIEERARELAEAEREAERERIDLGGTRGRARAGPHPQGRRRRAAAAPTSPGVTGSLADLLVVETGFETAIAAALGAAADAIAVDTLDDAVGALDHLKAEDAGRVGLLVGGVDGAAGPSGRRRAARRRPLGAPTW